MRPSSVSSFWKGGFTIKKITNVPTVNALFSIIPLSSTALHLRSEESNEAALHEILGKKVVGILIGTLKTQPNLLMMSMWHFHL